MRDAGYWIKNLNLLPHPEGGYYKETYRSTEEINSNSLSNIFKGNRAYSTAIYFLLEKGNFSAFHRIKSDEIWHFYDGDPILIHVIDNNGKLTTHELGLEPQHGIIPQITVPANTWFASESKGNFSLAGCTVSPGFDFTDFEMADRNTLTKLHEQYQQIIKQFTR